VAASSNSAGQWQLEKRPSAEATESSVVNTARNWLKTELQAQTWTFTFAAVPFVTVVFALLA